MDLLKHGESAYPADAWVEQQYMKEDAVMAVSITLFYSKFNQNNNKVSPCPILPQNEAVNDQKSAPYLPIENNNNKNNIKSSPTAKF